MSFNERPQEESNVPILADVLERLAGALEQQTRTLLEVKADIAGLVGKLNRLQDRLEGLDRKRGELAGPKKQKRSSKRRTK